MLHADRGRLGTPFDMPGAMSFLGVAPEVSDPAINFALHNTRMVIDEAMMAKGIAMHCATAEDFLNVGFD